mgnify:CR=1 FL=1
MNLSTQPYKGARDFYPEDKRLQKHLFATLRRVVESFGYLEYDAPIIEPIELYLSKSSQEIVAEQTYNFLDRGKRHVTLRPEMTPTVSRLVAARRQELTYPLRWYSLPNLWRYERPQRGRLREHYQLNVDLFGVEGIEGDHELILIADQIMKAFGAKNETYNIRLNSRQLMRHILLEDLKLENTQAVALMRLIDRMHKTPIAEFFAQVDMLLTPAQREDMIGHRLATILAAKSLTDLPPGLHARPEVKKLLRLMELLEASRVRSLEFDISLMRGFDYYTDVVFEVFDRSPQNNRSMFGGGRYDGLLSIFGVQPLPTVGFGMGDVTLLEFLKNHQLVPELKPETDAVVILIGDVYSQAQGLLRKLRREGLRLAVDLSDKKLGAKLKAADKSGVRFVLFVGERELTDERPRLRDLLTGKEETHGLERTVSILALQHRDDEFDVV